MKQRDRTHRRLHSSLAAGGFASTLLCVGLIAVSLGSGCNAEAPPALYTPPTEPEAEEPEADAAADSGAASRELWFTSGPGYEALLARERRDRAGAVKHLDALLAQENLTADERGAAELLRGLEDLQADRDAEAADRFARARQAKGLAPIEDWLRVTEAEARLDAGQPAEALKVVEGVDGTPAVQADLLMVRGDARSRTKDPSGAIQAYRAYLKQYPDGSRRNEARLKLAALVEADAPAEALELFDAVELDAPVGDYGNEAREGIARLEKAGTVKREDAAGHEREVGLAELRNRLSRRQYKTVVKDADRYLSRHKKASARARCEVKYLKASAVFKQRQRAKARVHYDKAATECAKAGPRGELFLVKSRYQSGRGRYASGEYTAAAKAFESLAADFPAHSYADDAMVLAGESWEMAGKDDLARKAYQTGLETYPGDMAPELRRRLLVLQFSDKNYDAVLGLTEKALAAKGLHREERSKLHYFRGRALQAKGDQDGAVEAWESAVETLPLSYPSLQALSRLREAGAVDRGLAVLEAAGPAEDLALPPGEASERALVFARLGLGKQARAELDGAGIKGWPALAVLDRAGLYRQGQRLLANMGHEWRATPPVGDVRAQWELAHPDPFREIIGPGEKKHAVPDYLTFAIMQTESRFDPGATSWAGAKGLVQLMPSTAKGLASKEGIDISGDRLHDPATNLDLGMRYLGRLYARWGAEDHRSVAMAIPSYNAGAGAVDKWVKQRGDWDLDLFIEAIPYDETRKYTMHVLGRWMAYRWLYAKGDAKQRVPFLGLKVPERA